ncbi:tetratricopeptide repeat protein [uncultured Microscilla sp.]|uniref:tetratricopeptide repeat protein n=1 Tax=uncultured Microscilla sp. TaxID=432653 RepID=UPI00261159C0|nr:tetratricopeptide repeat protein [uncultured Microscilla sp.]
MLIVLKKNKGSVDSAQVDLLNRIAYLLTRVDPQKARNYCNQSIDLAKKVKYPAGVGRAYHVMGLAYYRNGNGQEAIKPLVESVKINEKLGNEVQLASSFNLLATVFLLNIKNFDKARTYYNKALQLSKKLNNKALANRLQNNIGLTYSWQNKHGEARSMFEKALKGYKELKKRSGESKALNNIGDTYESEGDYKKALEFYNKSLAIEREIKGSPRGMATTLSNVGSVHVKLKNYDKAEEVLQEALTMAEKVTAKEEEKEVYEVYAQLYEAKGVADKALKYYKKHYALKDSLFNIEKSRQIAEIETKYETEKKEKELALRKSEIVQKDKEISSQRSILIGLLLILTMAFFIVSRQRLRNRKNKEIFKTKEELIQAELKNAEQDLKFKNRELTTYALHIIQKNNILTELKDSIEEAVDDISDKESKGLSKLIHLINYSFNLDRDWQDFKIAFEQVHEGFFDKLQKRYPNISPSEIRLCSLLRLNFASKEIAAIMGISPDSVKVARYRLRKKLELSRNDSLVDFIRNM